ncbi:hypothetical protein FQA39_LY11030 [Lamprigera yunnana]|nr:hypothetical protein FQA39_LY11030 [Lamprigera yunnana]
MCATAKERSNTIWLKINNSGRYPEFPYISLCGRERNFVRCDDYPIVFTHVIDNDKLSYNHNDQLVFPFDPEMIYMSPKSGRVYHPAVKNAGSIGLVRSKLAIEFSKNFIFENGETEPPTHFKWNNNVYVLNHKWYNEAKSKP